MAGVPVETNESFRELLLGILDELELKFEGQVETTICVAGFEYAGESKFELASQSGKIGVLTCPGDVGCGIGNALLVILRMIVDDYFTLLLLTLEKIRKVKDAAEFLMCQYDCNTFHPMGKPSTFELYNEKGKKELVKVDPDAMDLWELGRIRKVVLEVGDFNLKTIGINMAGLPTSQVGEIVKETVRVVEESGDEKVKRLEELVETLKLELKKEREGVESLLKQMDQQRIMFHNFLLNREGGKDAKPV